MEFVFDLDALTIGDIEAIEEVSGLNSADIDWSKPSGKLMTAFVYVSGKRQDPNFTIEDARNVKVSALTRPEVDPTTEGGAS